MTFGWRRSRDLRGQAIMSAVQGDFSCFRTGTTFYTRDKVQTVKIRLPRTFSFGKAEPYLVTVEMVPKY